jgi:Holliday junction resolvasome RuvABC endonuclease subunit
MPRVSSSVVRILGLDPALRTLGYALVDQDDEHFIPRKLGLIKTAAIEGLSAPESNVLASKSLYIEVRALVVDSEGNRLVDEMRVESMSFPPNASSASKISLCWGVLSAISQEFGIPLKQASPQTIRKTLKLPDRTVRKPRRKKSEKPNPEQGRRKRTSKEKEQVKDDVLYAMEAQFGRETITRLLAASGIKRKVDKRHPVDALAAGVAIR